MIDIKLISFVFVVTTLSARVALAQAFNSSSTVSDAPAQPVEVLVQGTRSTRDAAAIQLNASDARHVAGTQGDPVKIVESLPGVAHTPMSAGPLVLWGASPNDSRYFVDGVEIPRLFHGASVRSTINGDWVNDVIVTPGAYGPAYGRALGGVVSVQTKRLPLEDTRTHLDVNTMDSSAQVTTAVSSRVRVGVAGRYGWLDRVASVAAKPEALEIYPIPRYRDAQAKVEIDLRDNEGVDLVWLGVADSRTFTAPDNNPALVRDTTTDDAFGRVYARYHRRSAQGEYLEIVPWFGHDSNSLSEHFGSHPSALTQRDWRWGLKASHVSRLSAHIQLDVGTDVASTNSSVTRRGSLTIPAREGDITVFGQPPGDDFNVDNWHASVIDVGPYVQGTFAAGAWTFMPSLRLDGYLLETSRQTPRVGETPSIGYANLDTVIQPRAQIQWQLSPKVRFITAAGRYSQPPAATDLSAVFGSPKLGPATASHVTVGETVNVSSLLSVGVTGFYERSSNLAVRDASASPRLAQALIESGEGRSYGVQTFIRQKPWHGFYYWIASTVSRSERRKNGDAAWRFFDYDEPLLLTMVAGKRIDAWTVSSRFRYARGLPRTPVISAFYVDSDNVYQPIFGPQNSVRLPDFWQLDLRVEYLIKLGEIARMQVYVEGLNVTNHVNSEDFVYNANYTQRGALRGLPFVGILGARIDL